MKVMSRPMIGIALFAMFVGVGIVRAESGYFAPVVYGSSSSSTDTDRISALEAEIAAMRSQVKNVGYVTESGEIEGSIGGPFGDGCCGGGGCACCDDCWLGHRGCGGVVFEAEALFVAYHRTDGMRVGPGVDDRVQPGYDFAPRITLGWAGCEGTGLRVRYFDYGHNQHDVKNIPQNFLSVDTWNLDLELFDTITLNRNWSIELSGGLRSNNFEEVLVDGAGGVRRTWFQGMGPVFAIEGRRHTCWGHLYGRFRGAALLGDKVNQHPTVGNTRFADVSVGMWEIAIGMERNWHLCNGSLAYCRVGLETQNWYNFTNDLNGMSHSDVGMGIGSISFGIER